MKHFRLLIALALVAFGPLAHAGFVQAAKSAITGGAGTVVLNGVNPADTLIFISVNATGSASTPSGPPTGFTTAFAAAACRPASESQNASIYYNQAPSSGTNSVSISYTAGGGGYVILVEWSGMAPSALDVAPPASCVANGGTAGSNSISSGTLGHANEVVFVALMENTSGAGTASSGLNAPPTGFTDVFSSADSSADFIYDVAYQVVSATTSVTASSTWTDTTAITSQYTLASFQIIGGCPRCGASVGLGFP